MRVPSSTYRLQLTADFTLHDAADRLADLADFGVDWIYLSPILQAAEGSTHGYDVVDHDRVDAARGGPDGLAALSREARRLGMGVLVDIVPNHMGIAVPAENRAWWDVLRHGRSSAYADWFDIDWAAADRIRIPVVGDDDLRPDGHIANLRVVDGELRYHDNRYPLAPGTDTGGTPAQVHARQSYELVGWRRADHELSYRRFFAINTLAGVRVEDPDVFTATHREIGRWFSEGLVDGLRIDHPDGLRNPAEYLARLRELTGGAYLLVEKILEPGEELPRWQCEGTTGYDSLALVDRVLTDPDGERPLGQLAARLAGEALDWQQLIHDTKRAFADRTLGSEVRRIARDLRADQGSTAHPAPGTGSPAQPAAATAQPATGSPARPAAGPDAAEYSMQEDAIAELLTCFPVYRSYLPHGREHLHQAAARARQLRPDLSAEIDRLLPVLADPATRAAARFQQTSGMVMAKGVEDTAFYRYSRLTSLNEVGGDPSIFAVTPQEFHTAMQRRQQDWPHAMNALTTHDTKRGEDTRARITALAEYPAEWAALLEVLSPIAPGRDRTLGNLVNQAVIGSWPASIDRLTDYAIKAAREAGTITTWTDNDERYEREIRRYIEALESVHPGREIEQLVSTLEPSRRANVLGAKLLNLMMPGVPDVYQGSEGIETSLVDPDNRRDVPWETLGSLHHRVRRPVRASDSVEVCKARIVREALLLRRSRPELFTSYAALEASGPSAQHFLGFDRGGAIAAVTRIPRTLQLQGWAGTTVRLPSGDWRDLLTGAVVRGDVPIESLFAELPVSLLTKES